MEWRYMIVDPDQNTIKNGYGPNNEYEKNGRYLSMWANFYQIDYFPLFSEVETEYLTYPKGKERFYKLTSGNYLDIFIYKKRIRILAEVFLKEANYRSKKINKYGFCYLVGLGLGAWKLDDIQIYTSLLKLVIYKFTLVVETPQNFWKTPTVI